MNEVPEELVDTQLELVRAQYGETIGPEEAYRLARNLANELLEENNNTKEDFEFTVCAFSSLVLIQ